MSAMQMKLTATQWHPAMYSLQSVSELGQSQRAVDKDDDLDNVQYDDSDDCDDFMMQIRPIKASLFRKVRNDNSGDDDDHC